MSRFPRKKIEKKLKEKKTFQVTDLLSISLASLQAVNLPELFNIFSALSVSPEVITIIHIRRCL